ncbi:MAG: methyltransferase, partial [Shewanella sp.]|nr:methyltransferase [Shewanella sp.]
MPFTFKQFHIDDHNCGMRVSTDAVVLGAWAKLVTAKRILDIGAGSGLLSIMAAQRSRAMIIGVEIDSKACEAAKENCSNSPWDNRLSIANQSIEGFTEEHIHLERDLFGHIICNPPYFVSGPQSCDAKRADARHTNSL